VTREISGEVELVPGVVGPARIVTDEWSLPYQGVEYQVEVEVEYDHELQRYVVRKFSVGGVGAGEITGDVLRMVAMSTYIKGSVLIDVRDLPNPDGREPWGRQMPEDVRDAPTRRALKWVAHWYRYAFAISAAPTKTVIEEIDLEPSTAGRWISKARQAKYLGPAEHGKKKI
jgi:hypothetical protein